MLELRDGHKHYDGTPALRGVTFAVRSGEIHAVVGENGAGKSTLMKILAGAHQPDAGTIVLDGEEVRFGHPSEARNAGVSIIYQEFSLLPDRTVAQNIYLGREPHRGPLVDTRAMERATADLLRSLNVEATIKPNMVVHSLSVAQQQTVEIAKALSFRSKVLVMDEPTAALSPHEVASLFDRVRLLRERGVAILYISHRLREIFDLAQRVTVLKDGRRVGTLDVSRTTSRELVKMMVGRDLDHYFPPRAAVGDITERRLAIRGGGVTGLLHDIDLDVRRGEIVGIGGLAGSGRTELAQALFGVRPFDSGSVEIDGKPIRVRSARQAVRLRMGFVPEDRKTDGLVLQLSVHDNSLLVLRGLGSFFRRRSSAIPIAELLRTLDLRGAGLDREVRFLSGGNQQKVVLASEAQILIFVEPTRGIDVGAKARIHDLMRQLARNGAAILMVSAELPELIGMSDRIVVMRNGTIAGELPAGPTESDIMFLATGEQDAAGGAA
ncbi:MAG: sugar ABC transporter ATP-binding protein [Armatimonadota bacterium]